MIRLLDSRFPGAVVSLGADGQWCVVACDDRLRSGARRFRGAGARCLAATAVFVVSAAGALRGQGLTGRAILSQQNFSSPEFTTSLFDQLYELRFGHDVSENLRYLLFFRGEMSNGHDETDLGSTSIHFRQIQPHAEASYTLPTLQLFGKYDLIDTRTGETGIPDDQRKLENLLGEFTFGPQNFPQAHFLVRRTTLQDDATSLDQKQTYLEGGLGYQLGKLSVGAIARRNDFEDSDLGLTRKTDGVQGTIAYADSFFGGRANVMLNALGSYEQETDTAQEPVASEVPEPIAHAFWSVDATPADSRDDPGIDTPRLIDGDVTRPTPIRIGTNGEVFHNIGADMGRFIELDTFRVHVRDSAGNLVPRGGGVDFTVYTSQDQILWNPISSGVATHFLAALSLYEVTFPKTTARYFKVVSFDLAPADAWVTEIQAFVHKAFAGSTTRRKITLTTGNAALTFHPFQRLTLSYFGLFNDDREEIEGAPTLTTQDFNQVGSAIWNPLDRVSVLGQYEWREVPGDVEIRQSYRAWTGEVRYTFLSNLDLGVKGVSSSQVVSGISSDSKTASVHAYMRFLRSLDFSTEVGVTDLRLISQSQTTRQWFVSGFSTADLTTDLHLRLDWSYVRGRQTAFVLLPVEIDERYTADLYYRPGPELGLGAKVGWVRSGDLSSPAESYLVEWRPFAYGALVIGARFDEDIEPFTHRKTQRVILDPHWTLNNHMSFDLSFTRENSTGQGLTNIFYGTFTVVF